MTCNTAKVSKLGPINQDMKVTTHSAVNTESALINGTTSPGTQEIGVKTKSVGSAFMPGSMGVVMKANGLTTTWRAWESTYGMMDVNIRDNIKTTRSTDSVFTPGLIRDATKASGTKENNMD